jgi:hypothetical protein
VPVPENYSPPLCRGSKALSSEIWCCCANCWALCNCPLSSRSLLFRGPQTKVINNCSLDRTGSNLARLCYMIENIAASFAPWQILSKLFIMSYSLFFLSLRPTMKERKKTSASLIGSAETTTCTCGSKFCKVYFLGQCLGATCMHPHH